jgi:hypothetical protein
VSTTDFKRKGNKTVAAIAAYLLVVVLTGIFLLSEQYWFIWAALSGAGLIILATWLKKINSHKILTYLVGANIVLDIIAIAIWAAAPATQWSIYQIGFTIVGAEAAVAAALFAVALFGLIKKKKWAPYLSVVVTVNQRVFATYVFFPSTAIFVTLIWSLVIIYFAYRDIKT